MSMIDPITLSAAGLPGVLSDKGEGTRIDAAVRNNAAEGPGNPFARMVDAVNALQSQAGILEEQLHSDNPVELHRVMIAAEQAGVAMDLLIEVRNRLVESYQELMRMQV